MTLQAYGYTLRGLPPALDGETTETGPRGELTVGFRTGPVADMPAGWVTEDGPTLRVGWAGAAEFVVRGGPTPTIAGTLAGLDQLESAFCCCLSVLPLALPLLGLEPLHGSGVRTPYGVLLILGRSGAGKSTLAAALVALGCGLLADDACAIDDDGRLWPAPPLLRLSDPAIVADAGQRIGTYDGKAVIKVGDDHSSPAQPAAIAVLDPGPDRDLAVTPVGSRDAFVGVLAHVRAPGVLAPRRAGAQLTRTALVTTTTQVGTMSYDPRRHPPEGLAAALVEWMSTAERGLRDIPAVDPTDLC